MSREKQNNCAHYDNELDCCKELSDWSDPMPVLQPCVEGACPKYKVRTEIEEMAKVICGNNKDCKTCVHHFEIRECGCLFYAKRIYEAGYRKQSEGEWEQQLRPYEDEIKCTVCGAIFNIIDNCTEKFDYCPNCGAKMKGGAE